MPNFHLGAQLINQMHRTHGNTPYIFSCGLLNNIHVYADSFPAIGIIIIIHYNFIYGIEGGAYRSGRQASRDIGSHTAPFAQAESSANAPTEDRSEPGRPAGHFLKITT